MGRQASRKFQKELNAGAVSLVLLSVLENADVPMYGYDIAKRLAADADDGLPMNPGAIYPVLRSLEKQGHLQSTTQPSAAGPPRRYYSLTASGRFVLAEWIDAWHRTKSFVDSHLESSHAPGRTARTTRSTCRTVFDGVGVGGQAENRSST